MKLVHTAAFKASVRCGPNAGHLKQRIDITEDWFSNLGEHRTPLGHVRIEGDELIIWNASIDARTKEPIETHVPITSVIYYEPLSAKRQAELYPKGIPGLPQPAAEVRETKPQHGGKSP